MSIQYHVVGNVDQDNALFVRVDSGQTMYRLLFDCGEECPTAMPFADLLALDHLLFSHLHMDHVSGFDSLFRALFNRPTKPMHVWGPPETSRIFHHRFQGFMWNLHANQTGTWFVHDLYPDHVATFRFEAHEAFAEAHPMPNLPVDRRIIDTSAFTVEATHMNHGTPSMAYLVHEKPRVNVDVSQLPALGLQPGAWLQQLKMAQPLGQPPIASAGQNYDWQTLRDTLLVETTGDSVAYLTDFLLDQQAHETLVSFLNGCNTIVCESQYRTIDSTLAQRNNHMTAAQAAHLANDVNCKQLILFHISERYRAQERLELLEEARAIFPSALFPAHWHLAR